MKIDFRADMDIESTDQVAQMYLASQSPHCATRSVWDDEMILIVYYVFEKKKSFCSFRFLNLANSVYLFEMPY